MIVCSCNVLNDKQVAAVLVGKPGPLRMSQVYACLGCRAQCGRCVVTIKRIQDVLRTMRLNNWRLNNWYVAHRQTVQHD